MQETKNIQTRRVISKCTTLITDTIIILNTFIVLITLNRETTTCITTTPTFIMISIFTSIRTVIYTILIT